MGSVTVNRDYNDLTLLYLSGVVSPGPVAVTAELQQGAETVEIYIRTQEIQNSVTSEVQPYIESTLASQNTR